MDTRKRWAGVVLVGVFLLVFSLAVIPYVQAECRVDQHGDILANMAVWRLIGPCTPDERLNLAIPGEKVVLALQKGHGIKLEGVVLTGDVMLDRLPVEPVTPKDLGIPFVGERLASGHIREVRRIRGPLILTDVEVQGVLATNFVRGGYLIIEGPVRLQKTVVQRSIDFSRTAFLNDVHFAGSSILYEGFFIQTVFAKGADFETVNFGTHSRFHKAVFGGQALFREATFQGLAEFLEVAFYQDADFSKVHFIMGTGFSGTQFFQDVTFSQTVFDREAYFRFAQFDGDVTFQGGSFGAAADFTEATFVAEVDFTGSKFSVVPQFPPQFTKGLPGSGNRLRDLRVQTWLFGVLFLVLLVFLYRAWGSRREKSPR